MRLTSILLALMSLTGYAGKHYAICMQAGAGAGCSHQQFTAKEARKIGTLLAAEPIEENIQVWVIDTRKHKLEAPEPTPEPEDPTHPKI